MNIRASLVLLCLLAIGHASSGQDSAKVSSEYPVFARQGLKLVNMPSTFGDIRILKQVDPEGTKGNQYDSEVFSYNGQGLIANHFGLSLGLATQHWHSGEGDQRSSFSSYTLEPGFFVPISIKRSAINLYSKLNLNTFKSKYGQSSEKDWNRYTGWSAGINYPIYLPQHNLAVTMDGSYGTISDLDGEIGDPNYTGLTFSLTPQLLYSPELERMGVDRLNFQKGTWSLDGKSMLFWNRDRSPELAEDEVQFASSAYQMTIVRRLMKIKGSYYFLNALAVHCDIGYTAQKNTSESPSWSNSNNTDNVIESVLHYSLGLRVHPRGPNSDFYLGASVGKKAAKYEEVEVSQNWSHEFLVENTEGFLYQFEMGFYAHVLPSIALDPHIAYGRTSADTGSQLYDQEGLRIGLGIVAFFQTNP